MFYFHGNFYRKSDTATNICIPLLITLISNPYNIGSNGVLLSYGGTIGIICFLNILEKKDKKEILTQDKFKRKIKSYIRDIFLVSFSAQIVIMPIIAYSYKNISLTFFITNILTSFLIGLIIIFGFVIILISFINLKLALIFGNIYKILIELLIFITKYTSKIPFSKIYIKMPYLLEIIAYYIIIYIIYYCIRKNVHLFNIIKKHHKKAISIILIITLISILIHIENPKGLKIYFIDVGQGDSCLIITPQNTKILVDGGGSETYDVGKNILLPYLLSRRITNIDYIICSHFDTDHCGRVKIYITKFKSKKPSYFKTKRRI